MRCRASHWGKTDAAVCVELEKVWRNGMGVIASPGNPRGSSSGVTLRSERSNGRETCIKPTNALQRHQGAVPRHRCCGDTIAPCRRSTSRFANHLHCTSWRYRTVSRGGGWRRRRRRSLTMAPAPALPLLSSEHID